MRKDDLDPLDPPVRSSLNLSQQPIPQQSFEFCSSGSLFAGDGED